MIATSMFMNVICSRKVPKTKKIHKIALLTLPLTPKFSKSNSPSESKYVDIIVFMVS